MALIYVDDLHEGMVLASDLQTPKGRFILASGAALRPEHLKILKSWGVYEANIADDSLGEEYHKQQEELAAFDDQAEAYLLRRLILNDLEQEPLNTTYRNALRRCSKRLQQGWVPVVIASDLSVPEMEPAYLNPVQVVNGEIELFALPDVYNRIVETLNSPTATSHKVAEVISKDASLTLRLLELVNSPVYGFAGKIESVSRAVSLLGTNELTTLALGVSTVQNFRSIPNEVLDMESFWKHSIRCGLFAQFLASHIDGVSEEKCFVGGLLHDIGRLLLLQQNSELYGAVMEMGRKKQTSMSQVEKEYLRTDHALVGKLLAGKWKLPISLTRMIGGHHAPSASQFQLEACIVHVSDVLAHTCGDEAIMVNEIPKLQVQAWEELKLPVDVISSTIRQVDAEYLRIASIFLDKR